MKYSKLLFNQKGVALVTVILAISVTTILVMVVLQLLVNELRSHKNIEAHTLARYEVEGFLEEERKNIFDDIHSILANPPSSSTRYYEGKNVAEPLNSSFCNYNQHAYTLEYHLDYNSEGILIHSYLTNIYFKDAINNQIVIHCNSSTTESFSIQATMQLLLDIHSTPPKVELNYLEVSRQ